MSGFENKLFLFKYFYLICHTTRSHFPLTVGSSPISKLKYDFLARKRFSFAQKWSYITQETHFRIKTFLTKHFFLKNRREKEGKESEESGQERERLRPNQYDSSFLASQTNVRKTARHDEALPTTCNSATCILFWSFDINFRNSCSEENTNFCPKCVKSFTNDR